MEDLLNKIEDTIPGEMIISLREVYRELDEKQSRFQKDFPVHCIESCGEHWSTFVFLSHGFLWIDAQKWDCWIKW